MGRLKEELLQRVENFADRILRVAEALDSRKVSRRILDQIVAAGTSVGANVFEADEAMSRPDFVKTLSVAAKELAETRFWLRLVARNGWLDSELLRPLLLEVDELRRVLGTIITKSKPTGT
ncbi:MAG: four helix bundle protein [Phycisphaerales bacterium]